MYLRTVITNMLVVGFQLHKKNILLHQFHIPNTSALHLPPPTPLACTQVRHSISLTTVVMVVISEFISPIEFTILCGKFHFMDCTFSVSVYYYNVFYFS